mmetsp:Transcript_98827/g.176029  ORF Transcript_98827/g.176029 Transcript_98827/m.176029 type:complete len:206 (+) Transcript_98827:1460-2077(+)
MQMKHCLEAAKLTDLLQRLKARCLKLCSWLLLKSFLQPGHALPAQRQTLQLPGSVGRLRHRGLRPSRGFRQLQLLQLRLEQRQFHRLLQLQQLGQLQQLRLLQKLQLLHQLRHLHHFFFHRRCCCLLALGLLKLRPYYLAGSRGCWIAPALQPTAVGTVSNGDSLAILSLCLSLGLALQLVSALRLSGPIMSGFGRPETSKSRMF